MAEIWRRRRPSLSVSDDLKRDFNNVWGKRQPTVDSHKYRPGMDNKIELF